MPTYRFEKISTSRKKTWKDPVTGKRRSKTMTFWQTQNPFNKNADGTPKSYDQIRAEIEAEADAWMAKEGI